MNQVTVYHKDILIDKCSLTRTLTVRITDTATITWRLPESKAWSSYVIGSKISVPHRTNSVSGFEVLNHILDTDKVI